MPPDNEAPDTTTATTADRAATAHNGRQGHARRKRRPPLFYAEALDERGRSQLADAAVLRGLDQEAAVLRVCLRKMLTEQPDEHTAALQLMALLVRTVSAAAKLTPAQSNDAVERLGVELSDLMAQLAEQPQPAVQPNAQFPAQSEGEQ